MSARKRPKEKVSIKISPKKPRDPVVKEVTKRRSGPMKDRRKEQDWREENESDQE